MCYLKKDCFDLVIIFMQINMTANIYFLYKINTGKIYVHFWKN